MKIKHLKYYLLFTSLFLSKVVYAANKVNEAASGGEKISNLQLKEYGVFLDLQAYHPFALVALLQ